MVEFLPCTYTSLAKVGSIEIDVKREKIPFTFSSYGFSCPFFPHDNGGLACLLIHLKIGIKSKSAKFFTNEGEELITMREIRDYICTSAIEAVNSDKMKRKEWLPILERLLKSDTIFGSMGSRLEININDPI